MIKEFQKEYRWLSNFAPVQITLNGIAYPSVEHAYMSAKSESESWKKFCADIKNSAGEVKKESRLLKKSMVSNWDNIKTDVMRECLVQKYTQQLYKNLLLETGSEELQEGNNWNDRFWGVCLKTGIGKNHLGQLIMQIRAQLDVI